ncbi:Transposase and inactivated derivatives [Serratia fonticola]|uniref:IS66 family transposase n=1 Tax=Serratia fonticola TaxID=47917 RepID=UPI00217AAF02|nr:IS66 family transposase [Serratia fonticola]CAI1910023.1 Transposase and inactivated derivatives [Serratia fonticola]
MKNLEYPCQSIITSMDISLLTTTNNIEQLRAMALAIVQKVVTEKNAELTAKDQRIRLLEEALLLARQQRFGRKTEMLSGLQRQLFEEDTDADIAAAETQLNALLQQDAKEDAEKSSASRPVRKALPSQLPRVKKTIPPVSDTCTDCDVALRFIRDEISEKLEYIPARFVVNQYVRPQHGCPCCEKVFSGQMPTQLIPKGIAEASLVAQVVVSKYRDYQPLYRQQHIFARADVELPVSTMAGWVGAAGVALNPLAELLHRELLTRSVVHADETTMRILDTRKGGKTRSGYLWAYASGEKSGPAIVCFDSQTGRGHEHPAAWLQGWQGSLVVDGHTAYKTLAENVPGITLVGCWAHARRGFADLYKANKDPRAAMAVRQIAGLYRLEKKIRHRPVDKIRQWRQRYSRPVIDKLWLWLEQQKNACPENSALGKAVGYVLKRRETLSRFLDDGTLPLDNNRCERAIRPVVMGRSNWLFAGSLAAGSRAAQIISLLETAKMNGLEPHAWLTDVLKRLPEWPEARLAELLPLEGFTFSG